MKVYIASKFDSRYRLRPIAFKIRKLGFTLMSHWIDENPLDDIIGGDYDVIEKQLDSAHKIAERDIQDVLACDIFIIDTQDISSTGGRECELGMALITERPYIFRVGKLRNVFHGHKAIRPVNSWEEMLMILETVA